MELTGMHEYNITDHVDFRVLKKKFRDHLRHRIVIDAADLFCHYPFSLYLASHNALHLSQQMAEISKVPKSFLAYLVLGNNF